MSKHRVLGTGCGTSRGIRLSRFWSKDMLGAGHNINVCEELNPTPSPLGDTADSSRDIGETSDATANLIQSVRTQT